MIDLSSAKPYIEMLYMDTCNVIETQSIKDPETGITSMEEVIVYENIPCKVSYKTIKESSEGVSSSLILSVKLLLSLDYKIKAGSKIEVTRKGTTTIYKSSSKPAIYHNHQEILLELFKEWA